MPTIVYGFPVPGRYTATLPATIDPKGGGMEMSVLLDTKQIDDTKTPAIGLRRIPAGTVGGQSVNAQVVDLEPATTYHYRFALTQYLETKVHQVLGPEGTFTTLPPRVLAQPVAKRRFRLRKGQVRLGPIRRNMGVLRATVRDLPAQTVVTIKFFAGKVHVKARKKAKSGGRVRFKVRLAKKIRRALQDEKLKKVRIRVSANPPDERTSSVVLKRGLKG